MSAETSDYQLEWVADIASPAPTVKRSPIGSLSELDERLDRLYAEAEAGEPFIVELVQPQRGAALGMGLGKTASVLAFKQSELPPYYQSVGDAEPLGGPHDLVVFYYQGQWTEFPAKGLVSMESARSAMRTFFQTGERPNNIRWEEI